MRAVWWREVRELLLPGLGAVVALAALGGDWAMGPQRADRVALFGVVGAGLGLFHGLLDRRRRDDGFLLHRPIPALALHGMRALAGLAWLLLGAVGFAAGLAYERSRWSDRVYGYVPTDAYSDIMVLRSAATSATQPGELQVGVLALFAAVTAAGWAAAKFGVARRRPLAAVLVAGIAVLGTWSFVARATDVATAAALAAAACVAWGVWGLLDLAGERR